MFTLKAPAKINWFLNILRRRSDGYHEIQSLIQKITLYDVLSFTLSDSLILNTSAPIPMESNLVYRAAVLLRERYGVEQGAEINLEKNIPMGAGLGGGSSDAASALQGLNRLWSLSLTHDELSTAAAELGSDVPFFLSGPLSVVRGRGEELVPCTALKPVSLLLVKPPFDVSTAWVYKNFAKLTKKDEKVNNITLFIRNIERAELSGMAGAVSNDLESVTINSFPVIGEIKRAMDEQGSVFSLMSGSGSTVFGVFGVREMAEEASKVFKGYWTAVVDTITN